MEPVLRYIREHVPEVDSTSTDFLFQEFLRLLDSAEWNPITSATGHHGIANVIQYAPHWNLSPGFRDFIHLQLSECEGQANVRRQLKLMWMFPLVRYLPWRDVDPTAERNLLQACNALAPAISPQLRFVEGKVYLTLGTFTSDLRFDWTTVLPNVALRPNFETSHITVVNSDVVSQHRVTQQELDEFNLQHDTVALSFVAAKHTVSLDWARFSVCVVVHVECPALSDWVAQFNARHHTNLQPVLHVTVAVLPR